MSVPKVKWWDTLTDRQKRRFNKAIEEVKQVALADEAAERARQKRTPRLIARGEVVLQEDPFKLFLRHKEGSWTRMLRLGLWAQEYIGETLSIHTEKCPDD